MFASSSFGWKPTQRTQCVGAALVWRWSSVVVVGPALNRRKLDVLCLLSSLNILLPAGTRQMGRCCFEVEPPTIVGDRPRINIGSESRVRRCFCCFLWLFNHVNIYT